MSVTTTAEHRALRDALRQFLSATSDPAEILAVQETELGYRPEMWQTMADQLGLQGMLVDEEFGGSGGGISDIVVVAEEFGRVAACSPFIGSSVLTTLAIIHCADEQWRKSLLPELAAGNLIACLAFADSDGWWRRGHSAVRATQIGTTWTLHGRAHYVLFGHSADLVVVVAESDDGTGLFMIDTADLTVQIDRVPVLDMTRPLSTITLDGTAAVRISGDGDGADDLSAALDKTLVIQAAERVGGARRCLQLTTDYAKTRHQFGRPIGSNQAIKHGLADMLRLNEPIGAAVTVAAHTADTQPDELPALASMLAPQAPNGTCRSRARASNYMARSASPGNTSPTYTSSEQRPTSCCSARRRGTANGFSTACSSPTAGSHSLPPGMTSRNTFPHCGPRCGPGWPTITIRACRWNTRRSRSITRTPKRRHAGSVPSARGAGSACPGPRRTEPRPGPRRGARCRGGIRPSRTEASIPGARRGTSGTGAAGARD